MARINNQAVMQKLIDDLKLYPGTDIIPTELAEKILPVFNVNEQDVNVNIENDLTLKPATIVRSAGITENQTSVTIYTTPATGKFYLTNVAASMLLQKQNTSAHEGSVGVTVTIDGTPQKLLSLILKQFTTSLEQYSLANSLNLQNPILIDASTNIILTNYNQITSYGTANIVGYTEA